MEHELKTWPKHFQDIVNGRKPFEVRENDREFVVEDQLYLREWCPTKKTYSGRALTVPVSCVLHGGQFGIEEGYCVMGLRMDCIRHHGSLTHPREMVLLSDVCTHEHQESCADCPRQGVR